MTAELISWVTAAFSGDRGDLARWTLVTGTDLLVTGPELTTLYLPIANTFTLRFGVNMALNIGDCVPLMNQRITLLSVPSQFGT